MSDNKNHIKTFTAEDIRNYWSGTMSPSEMHALEKASLDDPFLADALEGYSSVESQTAANDIKWLRKNLASNERKEKKAIPLFKQNWMRVAAALIIIGGLGTLSYFIFLPEKNKEVAQTESGAKKEQVTERKQDTVATPKDTPTFNFKAQPEQETPDLNANRQQNLIANGNAKKLQYNLAPAKQFYAKDLANAEETFNAPVVSDSIKLAKTFSDTDDLKKEKPSSVATMLSGKVSGVKAEEAPQVAASQNFGLLKNNISGRITNSKNEPIAGAVIKANNLDNVAVVSDKNGVFSFPASEATRFDSVSVNSIGYLSANVALNANAQNNIKLEENATALNDVVVVGYGSKKKSKPVRAAAVSPIDTLQPAPVDGWEDYYNYVQRSTESFPNIDGEIIVRFEIDKSGKPNNIVVEKSLTDAADKEAIRIVKEGPGWKANSKKKKVRLTIKF
ncbi:energy transducer TonB family protein [Pinibacter soli]|uniref:Carboxypeptidase-like regulatory domain-containing protein n=1 Tax=Pinibacter soli TaxID=3044211 RepID=A0ABT6RI06_9BACT|nr:carboxypeptidase-like regulatory domain-containing protein [Pinibacter soli]MDI3322207.1 carboxypeptidase-like regulatory domain-containing protein [Pinibacter soli]